MGVQCNKGTLIRRSHGREFTAKVSEDELKGEFKRSSLKEDCLDLYDHKLDMIGFLLITQLQRTKLITVIEVLEWPPRTGRRNVRTTPHSMTE